MSKKKNHKVSKIKNNLSSIGDDILTTNNNKNNLCKNTTKKQIIIKKPLSSSKLKRQNYYKALLERESNKKPTVCKYFLHGCCKLDDCGFSHDVTPDQMKKFNEPCKYYRVGECSKAEMCCFLHETFPCQFFHHQSGNICNRGNQCLFSHDPLTDEMSKALEKYLQTETDRGRILSPVKEAEMQYSLQTGFGRSIINSEATVETNIIKSSNIDFHELTDPPMFDIQNNPSTLFENSVSEGSIGNEDSCDRVHFNHVPFTRLFQIPIVEDMDGIDDKPSCSLEPSFPNYDPLGLRNSPEKFKSSSERNCSSLKHEASPDRPNILESFAADANNIPRLTRLQFDSESEDDTLRICDEFNQPTISRSRTPESITYFQPKSESFDAKINQVMSMEKFSEKETSFQVALNDSEIVKASNLNPSEALWKSGSVIHFKAPAQFTRPQIEMFDSDSDSDNRDETLDVETDTGQCRDQSPLHSDTVIETEFEPVLGANGDDNGPEYLNTAWKPIPLDLPAIISYWKMDIDCFRLRHKFEDPRICNHPKALKPNWADWLLS